MSDEKGTESQEMQRPLDSPPLSESQIVEEAQLESRSVPKIDLPNIPHGFGSRLLMRLTGAKTDSQIKIQCALLFILVTFVPSLIMSLFQGTAFPGSVKVPLLVDYITLSRLLLGAPILILSDILTRPYLIKVAKHFLGTFIYEEDTDKYTAMFNQVFRIRDSFMLDCLLLVIAAVSSIFNASMVLALDVSSWHLVETSGTAVLSAPGMWNAVVAQPLFRFVILGWVFDYLLWVYFLFRVSRFKLNIIATHPDCAGGLSFVSDAQTKFCFAAFSLSIDVCGVVAHAVLYGHAKLQSFANLGIVFVAAILVIFVGPLLVFTPTLYETKSKAIFSYGSLAHEISKLFAAKWLRERNSNDESILASMDPSSLADLNSSYRAIADTRPFIFERKLVVLFTAAAIFPALPLVATVMPLKDLLMQLFKMLT